MKLFKYIVFSLYLLAFSSCISLNSHQTGRTLGKDNYSLFGNFNFGKVDAEEFFTVNDSGMIYIAEIGGVWGVKEKIDLGFKFNSSLHCLITSKYQFLGSKKSNFASSVGLDIGTAPLPALALNVTSFSSTLSFYNSYHPRDNLSFTLSPRYTYLGLADFSEEYTLTGDNNIFGYSAGIIFGEKNQFSIELSQYVNNEIFSFDRRPVVSVGYILKL